MESLPDLPHHLQELFVFRPRRQQVVKSIIPFDHASGVPLGVRQSTVNRPHFTSPFLINAGGRSYSQSLQGLGELPQASRLFQTQRPHVKPFAALAHSDETLLVKRQECLAHRRAADP